MSRYFDISDFVRFARGNRGVSGIQRVQMRVIRHLAGQPEGEHDYCVYSSGRFSALRACRARDLFHDSGYDATVFLEKLGLEDPGGAFTQRELYDYLARYRKGSILRALAKTQLLFLQRLAPGRARQRLGLASRAVDTGDGVRRIETWRLRSLDRDDQLVLMGTNWNASATEPFARRHRRQGGRVVQVVYDLIPYRYPNLCVASLAKKFDAFLARSTTYASRYVCISEATKRDMQTYLRAHGRAADVVSWPLAHEFEGYGRNSRDTVATDPSLVLMTGEPFVLCVGTIEIRKNGILLLRAWQRLIEDLGARTPRLVFAGKYGWKIDDFRELLKSDAGLAERVCIIDRPTDQDLANLYQRCLFTAYPSLVEGWGLPVGEAAWFGKYSVVSSSSSLPEVCGQLLDYVAPDDAGALAHAVKRAILDESYRLAKEQQIRAAPLRSWADAAAAFSRCLK